MAEQFDAQQFEADYETWARQAVQMLVKLGFTRAIAEEACQATAEYLLNRARQAVNKKVFLHRVRRKARDLKESNYGSFRRVSPIAWGFQSEGRKDLGAAAYIAEADQEERDEMMHQMTPDDVMDEDRRTATPEEWIYFPQDFDDEFRREAANDRAAFRTERKKFLRKLEEIGEC